MPLDATVAGASADSYLTVADADALANEDLGPQAVGWLAASVPMKEKALKRATREIDLFIGDLGGLRYAATQRLLFPRAIDVSGTPATPFIHRSIRSATYEQAAYVLANADKLDEAAQRRARGLFAYSNPDGTGGSVAVDPAFGRLSPDVEGLLLSTFKRRVRVGTLRVRSSIEPSVTATT